MTKTAPPKIYEKVAKERMKTKPVPLGTEPKPPRQAKTLKRGGAK